VGGKKVGREERKSRLRGGGWASGGEEEMISPGVGWGWNKNWRGKRTDWAYLLVVQNIKLL
jgi:hypothetical protein